MESASNLPSLCRGNCGFYGSATLEGLCSLCHKDHIKKKNVLRSEVPQQPEASLQRSSYQSNLLPRPTEDRQAEPGTGIGNTNLSAESEADKEEGKKKKNRCAACRKKVGLTGFDCRCGGLFCPAHRYSDAHNCAFDYRQLGAEEIKRNNPVIVAEKVHKI